MLKEQFLPVLSSVCAAIFPESTPGTEQKEIVLKHRAPCKSLCRAFLIVKTLLSGEPLIMAICFSLTSQARRGR